MRCCELDCLGTVIARQLCSKHYGRWYKHGSTSLIRTPNGEPLKYFTACLLLDTDDCIVWKYGKTIGGYGQFFYEGKLAMVHRLSLIKKVSLPPKGKPFAIHSCHNASCFNSRHLRWGSPKENSLDMVLAGNSGKGVKNRMAKLTQNDVGRILKDNRTHKQIAANFGVSRSLIGLIKNRKSWGWL